MMQEDLCNLQPAHPIAPDEFSAHYQDLVE